MMNGRHTLLIVDDEVDLLDSLCHQFRRAYRVLTATSGASALDLMRNEDVHVILSDQRMPGMSGDVFLSQAKGLQPDAVRMLFTGYADIQAVINAVNEGHIYRYILKPWDSAELESVVRQAAEQYEILAERKRLIRELRETNSRLLAANRDLALADQLKTAFVEVASHEFNTPITLVLGLTELLCLSNPDRPAEDREIIEQILASSRQLSRLVTNMITLLRAEDFRRTLKRELVELSELIRGVVDQVHPFIQARSQRIEIATSGPLGDVEVDPDKLRMVLVNLLTNAIKFTPDGGLIRISAWSVGDELAEIEVEDHGVGLVPQELSHLFEPFFTQLDPSRHSSGEFGFEKRGLGLGLCIAKQFVEMHGGRIWAQSIPGGGTRVTISLPRRATLSATDESLTVDGSEVDVLQNTGPEWKS